MRLYFNEYDITPSYPIHSLTPRYDTIPCHRTHKQHTTHHLIYLTSLPPPLPSPQLYNLGTSDIPSNPVFPCRTVHTQHQTKKERKKERKKESGEIFSFSSLLSHLLSSPLLSSPLLSFQYYKGLNISQTYDAIASSLFFFSFFFFFLRAHTL
ncbi:hypothetical protein ACMFMG_005381 [Clarireedia jacksonii]